MIRMLNARLNKLEAAMTKKKKPKKKPTKKKRLSQQEIRANKTYAAVSQIAARVAREAGGLYREMRGLSDRIEWMNARLSSAELGIIKKQTEVERLTRLTDMLNTDKAKLVRMLNPEQLKKSGFTLADRD